MFPSPIIMQLYQKVCSVKRSKLDKFPDDIISIEGVMVSRIILHDVKMWWQHCLETLQTFLPGYSDHLYQFLWVFDRDLQKFQIRRSEVTKWCLVIFKDLSELELLLLTVLTVGWGSTNFPYGRFYIWPDSSSPCIVRTPLFGDDQLSWQWS